jgi:hypothetical protein
MLTGFFSSLLAPADRLVPLFVQAPVHELPEHGILLVRAEGPSCQTSCSSSRRTRSQSPSDISEHGPRGGSHRTSNDGSPCRLLGHPAARTGIGAILRGKPHAIINVSLRLVITHLFQMLVRVKHRSLAVSTRRGKK